MNSSGKPLFSVLIANYNNGEYLETCLQSIISQTYQDWEIVIVDDASTDNSGVVYEKYSSYSQVRVYINNGNKGCGFTKRKCVGYAKGALCGFVDADDALLPEALEVMVKEHQNNPEYSVVYSTHYICNDKLEPQSIADYVGQIPRGLKSITLLLPTISHFATFKKSKYKLTKGISEMYDKAVDKDLYYKLEETGSVLFVDRPLYLYRHHASSISLNSQARKAHYYELTAKVLALFRQGDARKRLKDLPHSSSQLIGSVINVAFYEIKKWRFFISFGLLWKLFLFPFSDVIKFVLEKGIQLWRVRGHSSR